MVVVAGVLLCLAFSVKAYAATPYEKNGRLHISASGNVVNQDGDPFVIKGVSTHGINWFPEYVNTKAFKSLRDDWHANTIRLAMYTSEYNGYCTGGNKEELLKTIDHGVKCAKKLGMYVIIDWHILSDGNPLTYRSEANKFFKKVAKKYASYKNVMFEICNEPNGYDGNWANIKKYSKKIIKTIRTVNKKAIIIVGTPTWDQDIENAVNSPIKGFKNIAYSYHFYAGTHKDDFRKRLRSALKTDTPVIVTEFGISEAWGGGNVDKKEGNKWLKLLDKYKAGRVIWNLSAKNESSSLLKPTCRKTGGFKKSDLSESGKWIRNKYRQ